MQQNLFVGRRLARLACGSRTSLEEDRTQAVCRPSRAATPYGVEKSIRWPTE